MLRVGHYKLSLKLIAASKQYWFRRHRRRVNMFLLLLPRPRVYLLTTSVVEPLTNILRMNRAATKLLWLN